MGDWLQYWRYTYGYTWRMGLTVAAVLAIYIWIHVASGVKVAVVLATQIWVHVAIG